jgi:hypothetical protein
VWSLLTFTIFSVLYFRTDILWLMTLSWIIMSLSFGRVVEQIEWPWNARNATDPSP